MIKVDLSDLKVEGKEVVDELLEFIKARLGVNPEVSSDTMKLEGEKCTKEYMRVLLRKFLHKNGLKPYYRVISGGDDVLIIKERKIPKQSE
ncbi:MAG: hypothetical protein QXR17_01600 [Candidatus Bathyarchaeia archaeon]|nr:hypothetical protein [Candidatus Bathyarchaeota archaeon]